jgi:hypothetical protein
VSARRSERAIVKSGGNICNHGMVLRLVAGRERLVALRQ